MPCTIDIEWAHNHSTKALQARTFKDISPETVGKVQTYFENGCSPGKD